MHSQVMSLMNIIIEKKWTNESIINVFKDQEIDEQEEENKEGPKQYTVES